MVKAAFYIGSGTVVDKLIKWKTSSDTSHVEVVVGGTMFSSSLRDGGVRLKPFPDNRANWRLVDVPNITNASIYEFFEQTRGCAYDLKGVLLGSTFSIDVQSKDKWFCSEWCAHALGFEQGWRFTPASLEVVLNNQILY